MITLNYDPNFEKLGKHFGFGLCIRVCARPFIRDIVLKLHVWIPHGKIAETYFSELSPLVKLRTFEQKNWDEFCKRHISNVFKLETLNLVI